MKEKKLKPIVLVILDGWGISPNIQGNAIAQAKKPFFDELDRFYPSTALQASGISAGLPWNEMGNSEVGHLLLGAGQVIYQNLPRITLSIQDGNFFKNKVLLETMSFTKKNNSALHIMGLISSAGVHSHLDHLSAILEMVKQEKVSNIYLHLFTDGRDSSPTEGAKFIERLQEKLSSIGTGKIASIIGRYYAMDRNNNWDRIQKAYDLLAEGKADVVTNNPVEAIKESYKNGITDEFIKPILIKNEGEEKLPIIQDNDAVIFFNFREDRARQITQAFVLKKFEKFKRKKIIKNLHFTGMTEYEKDLPIQVISPQKEINNPLAKILSKQGLSQLHIAETEKYAHATYFFNGGIEKPFKKEKRILIPSPSVSNYEKTPEMSALKITDELEKIIKKNIYDFILVNYANPDMLGHTGNLEATIKAIEFIDKCISRLTKQVLEKDGALIITADHGDAEEMINLQTGEKLTEHSINPVPAWIITPYNRLKKEKNQSQILKSKNTIGGLIADIAPTVLELFEIPKSSEMTGHSLLDIVK